MLLKIFPILFFLFSCFCINAQINLIPNPDFEDYYDCEYDILSDKINDVLPFWYHRVSSPRYFNVDCINNPNSSYFETNLFQPQSGKGYISLVPVSKNRPDDGGWQLRQYAQVRLIEPLEVGEDYLLSYYLTNGVGFTDSLFEDDPHFSHHGVYFSDTLIEEADYGFFPWIPLILEPQLEMDTLVTGEPGEWREIVHCFTADAPHEVMTIGIFAPIEEVEAGPILFSPNYTSYDNFLLTKIEEEISLDFQANDTICQGDCVLLSSNHSSSALDFTWDLPGSDIGSSMDSVVRVCYEQAGLFDVGLSWSYCVDDYQQVFPDAITVLAEIDFEPPWQDTIICPGAAVTVDLSNAMTGISWWDNSQESIRIFSDTGTYAYVLTNGFCEEEFAIKITHSFVASQQFVEALVCPGDSFQFLNQLYHLPGLYYDTISDQSACDSIIYAIDFSFIEENPIALAGDLVICEGEETILELVSAHQNALWSDGSTGSTFQSGLPGAYSLSATDVFGCPYDFSFELALVPVPEVSATNLLDTIFPGGGLQLPVSYQGEIISYQWSNGEFLTCSDCPFPVLNTPQAGQYLINVENQFGCTDTAIVTISFEETKIYIPNVVRLNPNDDLNRRLFAQSNHDIPYNLSVYDRWGSVLYAQEQLRTNDSNQGWLPNVNPGVYVYMVIYWDNIGQQKMVAGDFTVW